MEDRSIPLLEERFRVLEGRSYCGALVGCRPTLTISVWRFPGEKSSAGDW